MLITPSAPNRSRRRTTARGYGAETPPRPARSYRPTYQRDRQRQHGKGNRDHMRVQVGKQKAEKGELVDRIGDDARGAVPIVERPTSAP